MEVPPIVEREFRVALRRHAAGKTRFQTAAVGSALVALFMLFAFLVPPRAWGATLHEWLFYGSLYLAVRPALQISSALFQEERRNETMGLLHLAGMGPGALFIGKLFGGLFIAWGDLLAAIPLLAVPFLSGGVSFPLYAATVASLPVLFLFAIATGVLASVLWHEESAALFGAIALGAAVCVSTPIAYYLGQAITGARPFSPGWLCLSPAYGPFLVIRHFLGGSQKLFWSGECVTLAIAAVEIMVAAIMVNQNWRVQVRGPQTGRWQELWQRLAYGSADWRAQLRQRILTENPFRWLAERDRSPVLLAWMILLGGGGFWLLIIAASPRIVFSSTIVLGLGLLLTAGIQMAIGHAARRRLATGLRDGTLELLLTTPLSTAQITGGQLEAVKAQFRPVLWALTSLGLALMLSGLAKRTWVTGATIDYCLVWTVLLVWPWAQGRPAAVRAMARLFGIRKANQPARSGWFSRFYWVWYYLWYGRLIVRTLSGNAVSFPTGQLVEVIFVSIGFVTIVLVAFIIPMFQLDDTEKKLSRTLRNLAQEPAKALAVSTPG